MGTWGSGLMEGDGPLDYIGTLTLEVEGSIKDIAGEAASETSAARLGAATGLLLQISPYSFESDFAKLLKKALQRQSQGIATLSEGARKTLDQVVQGNGPQLAGGNGAVDETLVPVLGKSWAKDTRQPALFAHPAAAAYVQSFAEGCADFVDAGFQAKDLDLYQVDFMGVFGVLLIIAPFTLDRARVAGWREQLRRVHQKTEADREDLEFFEEYMANAEKAFDLLTAKLRA